MKLSDLCGEHVLQGVDSFRYEREDDWNGKQTVDAISFQLDGQTYLAVEDPDDGYRSRCEELVLSDTKPRYMVPNVRVIGRMMDNDDFGSNDVLILTDVKTGKSVLEVGTGDYDDWYPYCHFEYHPENLACNQ